MTIEELNVPAVLKVVSRARTAMNNGDTSNANAMLEVLEEHLIDYLGDK